MPHASSPAPHTPSRETNDGSDVLNRGPPSTISRLITAVSRVSLNEFCPHTGIAFVTTPLRKMSSMFINSIMSLQRQIMSLQRQRDEAEIFARGHEITTYNILAQRDRLAERNMQLEFENEAAMQLLKCSYCRKFKKEDRYAYVTCGHSICIECQHYKIGNDCPICNRRARKTAKTLVKLR